MQPRREEHTKTQQLKCKCNVQVKKEDDDKQGLFAVWLLLNSPGE